MNLSNKLHNIVRCESDGSEIWFMINTLGAFIVMLTIVYFFCKYILKKPINISKNGLFLTLSMQFSKGMENVIIFGYSYIQFYCIGLILGIFIYFYHIYKIYLHNNPKELIKGIILFITILIAVHYFWINN